MSGECGEHALECVCARCKIDKAANRNLGCDPSGTEIKDFYIKPMESIPIKNYDWIDVTKELLPRDGMYDPIIAMIVSDCLEVMRKHTYDTITKMTACYNLTERVLRLFSINGSKESLHGLMDEFHTQLKKDIDEYYYE